MKKSLILISITALFFACNGDVKVDENKIDNAGKDLQKSVKQGVDTIVSKAKKIKIKIETKDSDTVK